MSCYNLAIANFVAQGKFIQFFKSGNYQDVSDVMYTLNKIASNTITEDDIDRSTSVMEKMKFNAKVADMFSGIIPALKVYSKMYEKNSIDNFTRAVVNYTYKA